MINDEPTVCPENSYSGAYIIKRRAMLVHLNNLDTGICAVGDGDIGWNIQRLEAECPVAGLVEALDECDVERGRVIATEPKIHKCMRPRVTWLEDHRASVYWPCSPVLVGHRLIYPSTYGQVFASIVFTHDNMSW